MFFYYEFSLRTIMKLLRAQIKTSTIIIVDLRTLDHVISLKIGVGAAGRLESTAFKADLFLGFSLRGFAHFR